MIVLEQFTLYLNTDFYCFIGHTYRVQNHYEASAGQGLFGHWQQNQNLVGHVGHLLPRDPLQSDCLPDLPHGTYLFRAERVLLHDPQHPQSGSQVVSMGVSGDSRTVLLDLYWMVWDVYRVYSAICLPGAAPATSD